MRNIKTVSYTHLNVSYKPEDGKKRFPGVVVSIRELVNLPIVVKDFETGIKTEMCIRDRCGAAQRFCHGTFFQNRGYERG